jgi:hypothetical protein
MPHTHTHTHTHTHHLPPYTRPARLLLVPLLRRQCLGGPLPLLLGLAPRLGQLLLQHPLRRHALLLPGRDTMERGGGARVSGEWGWSAARGTTCHLPDQARPLRCPLQASRGLVGMSNQGMLIPFSLFHAQTNKH